MFVEMCRFVDGVHVDGPPNCAHMREQDELGDIMPVGWTVQNKEAYAAFLAEERQQNGK